MTAMTAFGPQGPNYSTTRPAADPKASGGIDTWFKNCSAAGAKDGTFATADFFNVTLGNLRYLCRTAGVTLDDADDTMVYQAVQKLIAGTPTSSNGAPTYLMAPKDFYVDPAGADTNDGLAATSGGGHGPFRTLQHVANLLPQYNLNGYDITIHLANGSYSAVQFPDINGSGTIRVIGNVVNPENVNIVCPAVFGSCGVYMGFGTFYISGIHPFATASGALDCIVSVGGGSKCTLGNIRFGGANRYHINAQWGGFVTFDYNGSNITLDSGANAAAHISAVASSLVQVQNPPGPAGWPTLTALGPVTFSTAFIAATQLGGTQVAYSAMSGAISGPRYSASVNGFISSLGGGANYYPGSSAGSTATGGQYI